MAINEMVERVARAICQERPDAIGPMTCDDGRGVARGKPAWTAWENDARAAIGAMREPTDKMVCAALDSKERAYSGWWRAMIDAALLPAGDDALNK